MKICPVCQTRFKDKNQKCRYCNVVLEPLTPASASQPPQPDQQAKQPKIVKDSRKKRQGKAPIERQTGFGKTWNRNKYPFIVVIILIVGILLAIVQKCSEKKVEVSNTQAVEQQAVYAPVNQPAASDNRMIAAAPARDEANGLFRKAFELCISGKCTDPQKAIEYLSEAITLKPDYADAYNNRGNAYIEIGQYPEAVQDYNESIKLQPQSIYGYNNRGLALSKLGKHQEAIADYNEAIRLKPDSAIIHNNRGAAYLALGQYQKAVEDFSEAVKIKPDYVDAYYNRANVYFDHMNKEDGCNDAQKACELGKCDLLEKVKGKGYCS